MTAHAPAPQISSGSGAPSASLGKNGDWYLRTDTGAWYQKSNGSWSISWNGGAYGQ